MKITIKLFATLRTGRFDETFLDIENSADIDYLLKLLNMKREDIAIIMINGRHGEHDAALNDGDVVALFPPIGGG